MSAIFDQCIMITLDGIEKGYQADPADRGNWTGGICGVGECKGTNFGISAASYPTLDIANITRDQAKTIYLSDFWTPIHGDALPELVAPLVFDAAVDCGVRRAIEWLQLAANVTADGDIGRITITAIKNAYPEALAIEFHARRIYGQADTPLWKQDGLGWSRRLATMPFRAIDVVSGHLS